MKATMKTKGATAVLAFSLTSMTGFSVAAQVNERFETGANAEEGRPSLMDQVAMEAPKVEINGADGKAASDLEMNAFAENVAEPIVEFTSERAQEALETAVVNSERLIEKIVSDPKLKGEMEAIAQEAAIETNKSVTEILADGGMHEWSADGDYMVVGESSNRVLGATEDQDIHVVYASVDRIRLQSKAYRLTVRGQGRITEKPAVGAYAHLSYRPSDTLLCNAKPTVEVVSVEEPPRKKLSHFNENLTRTGGYPNYRTKPQPRGAAEAQRQYGEYQTVVVSTPTKTTLGVRAIDLPAYAGLVEGPYPERVSSDSDWLVAFRGGLPSKSINGISWIRSAQPRVDKPNQQGYKQVYDLSVEEAPLLKINNNIVKALLFNENAQRLTQYGVTNVAQGYESGGMTTRNSWGLEMRSLFNNQLDLTDENGYPVGNVNVLVDTKLPREAGDQNLSLTIDVVEAGRPSRDERIGYFGAASANAIDGKAYKLVATGAMNPLFPFATVRVSGCNITILDTNRDIDDSPITPEILDPVHQASQIVHACQKHSASKPWMCGRANRYGVQFDVIDVYERCVKAPRGDDGLWRPECYNKFGTIEINGRWVAF